MAVETPDLVVLGAGAAGLAAATTAAGAGKDVLLLDGQPPGGDCTWFGCVPSKTLLETARRVHGARSGPAYGFSAPVEVDMAAITARVKSVVADVARDESAAALERAGVRVRQTRAQMLAPRRSADGASLPALQTEDGARLEPTAVVLATGGSAAVPPLPGLQGVPFLTNRTVFDLTELPGHLLVLGGGPIACELAQALHRLGAPVTVVEAGPRLLGRDEPEASAVIETVLRREGVDVLIGVAATEASLGGTGPVLTLADGRSIAGTHLLIATGRSPDTADLGLQAAGVAADERGLIAVDAAQRTTAGGVWAAGDCCSPLQLTHLADEQGRLAGGNAFARRPKGLDAAVVPWVTFTEPEVGRVGWSEAEAFEAYGAAARVCLVPLSGSDRARAAGETDGLIKLIAVPKVPAALARGPLASPVLMRVAGMTAVAPVGGELIAEAALAMRAGVLAARLAQTVHAYPTWSLDVRLAASQLFGTYGGATARPARPAT